MPGGYPADNKHLRTVFDMTRDAVGKRHPYRRRGRTPSRMPLTMAEGMAIIKAGKTHTGRFLFEADAFLRKLNTFDWETRDHE